MRVESRVRIPEDEIAAFSKRWRVRELSLFGSALRKDFGPDSDIDILVTFHQNAEPSLFDLISMEEELKAIFGRDVDLITRKSVEQSRNYIRRHDILDSAQVIYVAA